LSVTRKPDVAFEAAGGSHDTIAVTSSPAQRTLLSLLEMALGSPASAAAAVVQALALADRDELPHAGPEIVAFARAHLLMPLSDHIGPRLTMALLDDLIVQLDPASASEIQGSVPPASMPRPVARIAVRAPPSSRQRPRLGVLLVDADRVGRTTLARALLRAKWDVTLVDSPEDLASALAAPEPIDAAIIDAQHPAAHAVVEKLARERPAAAVVARSADPARARGLLGELGVVRFDVRSRDAPPEELIEAVKRSASG
jgi:hypothetical protein